MKHNKPTQSCDVIIRCIINDAACASLQWRMRNWVSFVRVLEKIHRVIKAPWCTCDISPRASHEIYVISIFETKLIVLKRNDISYMWTTQNSSDNKPEHIPLNQIRIRAPHHSRIYIPIPIQYFMLYSAKHVLVISKRLLPNYHLYKYRHNSCKWLSFQTKS